MKLTCGFGCRYLLDVELYFGENMKIYKLFRSIVGVVLISVLVSACATRTPISMADKQAINTISIDNNIIFENQAYYLGQGMSLFGMLGAVPAIMEGKNIAKYAVNNHVYVNQIVRDQFIRQLSTTKYKLADKDKADAIMHIKIDLYGVICVHNLSSRMSPIMAIDAKLINKNGKLIWQSHDSVSGLTSNMPRHTTKEIKTDPKNLYDLWNAAAERIAKNIVNTL